MTLWPHGSGDMCARIRAHDWAATPLGPIGHWPQSRRTAVELMLASGHAMHLVLGSDRTLLYNDAYAPMLGQRHPAALGAPFRRAWPEIWDEIEPLVDRIFGGETVTFADMPLVMTRHGFAEHTWWTFSGSPLRDESGAVAGLFNVAHDTSAKHHAELAEQQRAQSQTALAESESRYRALAEQLPGGAVFVFDRQFRYVMAAGNGLARAGTPPEQFVGRALWEAVAPETASLYEPTLRRAFAGEPFEFEHGVGELYFMSRGTPLRDTSGAVTGVLVASFDITERRRAEHDLRAASTRLEGLMAAGEIGSWVWDLRDDRVLHDANFARLFGWEGTEPKTRDEHFARVHRDDVAKVQTAVEAALVSGRLYIREYRIVLDDGSVRWLGGRGKVQRSAEGEAVQIAGLIMDIGDLKALEDTLRAADRQKDEFLATLAHELRNPLAPIANAAAILQQPGTSREQVNRYAKMIARQTRSMAVLLDDLLEVSRISTGKLNLKKKAISVAALVESALEPVRPALEARKHGLRVEMTGPEGLLEVDPVRISQVLTNLLTNAVKFSDSGAQIVLRARSAPDEVTFEVEDAGIGLPADQLTLIFEMFTQVSPSVDQSEGGLGIGLAVAKALVQLHGGRIEATSAGLGKGSLFRVVLPRGFVSPPAVESAAAKLAPRHTQHAAVVVADDNVDAAVSLAALLELDGYKVHVAHDGLQALQLANTVQPVACFLDLGMPGLDGLEVARRLKASNRGAEMVLIATTGWGHPEDRRRSAEAGFDVHLTKPIDPDRAADELARRLGEREAPA